MAGAQKTTRKCPICQQTKEIENRCETCSNECAVELRNRRFAEKKAAAEQKRIAALSTLSNLEAAVLVALRKPDSTIDTVAEAVDRSPKTVQGIVVSLQKKSFNVKLAAGGRAALSPEVEPGGEIVHPLGDFKGGWQAFGALGDNHLGSKHERIDVLRALYKIYANEGIATVYNLGNWIEGECRLNTHDIKVFGLDRQVEYFIENYPQEKGIKTFFISGDDHEGWYQKRESLVIGEHAMLRARAAGRQDLVWIGHLEADVELKAKDGGSCWMKLMHPGGGSAYALSYAPQKMVECVPLDSEILSESGWKKHDEVSTGERVMGYHIATDRCEWTTVTGVNHGRAEVVTYKNDQFVVRCTRNHKWAMEWESRGGPNPKSLEPGTYVRRSKMLTTIDEAKERSRIIQTAVGPDGPGASWDDEHAAILDRKNATGWVLKMTAPQRAAFVYGMMLGEGGFSGNGNTLVFSQRPGPIQDAFVLACFLEGRATGANRKTTKKLNGEDKVCCRTTVMKKRMRMASRSLREVASSVQDVWCPSTELGTWVMRQGDIVTITGNSFQGGEKPRVLLLGHYHKFDHCVPLTSDILTPSGWRNFYQMEEGETVLGYNTETDRCEWTTLRAINLYYDLPVRTYKSSVYEVRCTVDHRWPMVKKFSDSVLMGSIDATPCQPRIVQAAVGPEGLGVGQLSHADWLNRGDGVTYVLRMTSSERRTFIQGMTVGRGTLRFGQNPVNEAFLLACFLEGIATSTSRLATSSNCLVTSMLRRRFRETRCLRVIDERTEPTWCPTTDLGTWVMRQGSTITITGNCYPREVDVLQTGCTCDQSIFLRKMKIQAHVGGCIVRYHQRPDGVLNRFSVEWIPFYDRDFYSNRRSFR